jgi:hypothetical protein
LTNDLVTESASQFKHLLRDGCTIQCEGTVPEDVRNGNLPFGLRVLFLPVMTKHFSTTAFAFAKEPSNDSPGKADEANESSCNKPAGGMEGADDTTLGGATTWGGADGTTLGGADRTGGAANAASFSL